MTDGERQYYTTGCPVWIRQTFSKRHHHRDEKLARNSCRFWIRLYRKLKGNQ
jgi:hypothetical protein